MQTPLLIGIHGVKRSGKDTTAGFIERWASGLSRPLTVKRRGFADKAKWAFARQFFPDISMEKAIEFVDEFKMTGNTHISWLSDIKYNDRTVRSLRHQNVEGRDNIAYFATEGAREIYGDDHWVDLLLPTRSIINKYDLPERPAWHDEFIVPQRNFPPDFAVADICVITDERFENENKRVKTLGGLNWKVRRKDAENAVVEDARRKGIEVHSGELGIPDEMFDHVFNNDDNDLETAEQSVRDKLDEIFAWMKV